MKRARTNPIAHSLNIGPLLALAMVLGAGHASADISRGQFSYGSARNCVSAGKVPSDLCSNAEANSSAEFAEKTPHFPTRPACEQVYGRNECALGFSSGGGAVKAKGGVIFTPRQQGFRIVVKSERDATVIPVATGLSFSPRSILRRNTSIDPRASHLPRAALRGPAGGGQFGVSSPTGEGGGPLPPPPSYDPNFDCAAYLEPSAKGDARTGCAEAPRRAR